MSCELSTLSTGPAQVIGELCIYDVAAIKPGLMDLLVPGATREIELSQVTEIDGAGLQLLLQARRVADERGCKLTFSGASNPVAEVMFFCHLDADFRPLTVEGRSS